MSCVVLHVTQVQSYLSLHLVITTPRATARLRYSQAVSLPQLLQAPPTDQSRRRAVAGLAAPAAQQYATTQHIIQHNLSLSALPLRVQLPH